MLRILVILLVLSAGNPAQQRSVFDFTIGPDKVGIILPGSAVEDLAKVYGKSNMRNEAVPVGEGFMEKATILFPDNPARYATIIWQDSVAMRKPLWINLRGSDWHTAEGIRMGSTLKELEQLNGRAFTLSGFGWDYEGTITSWNGGKLEALSNHSGRVILRLSPDAGSLQEPELMGDLEVSSKHPGMQELNPRVYSLEVEFY